MFNNRFLIMCGNNFIDKGTAHFMAKEAMSSHLHSTSTQFLIEYYQIDQPRKTNAMPMFVNLS